MNYETKYLKYKKKYLDLKTQLGGSNENHVKKIIYTFWTGTNPMTANRQEGIKTMKEKTGVDICVISTNNLNDFIIKDYPLHPSYKNLSRVHKADYLRCYFMHHYGGGYADIKRQIGSWEKYFNIINDNPDIWKIGLGNEPDRRAFNIAYPEEYNNLQREKLRNYSSKMVGISFMICRPRTPYTTEWYNLLHQRLDNYSSELEKHPAVFSRESFDRLPSKYYRDEKDPELKKLPCPTERTKYPISWNRILGQIVYPLQVKYINHIKQGLPMPDFHNYA